jgi:hypothetical protein
MTRLHKPAVVAEHRKLANLLLSAHRHNQSVSVTTLRERCMVPPADGGPFVCRARRFLEALTRAGVLENVTPEHRRMTRYMVRDRDLVEQVATHGLAAALEAHKIPAPDPVPEGRQADVSRIHVALLYDILARVEGKLDRLAKAVEAQAQGELGLLALEKPRPPVAVGRANENGKAAG